MTVALVGKYIDLPDAYLSVVEALRAGLPMELVVETIPDAVDPRGKLVWKWKPMEDAR